jgi:hypothetical protein
MEHRIQTSRGEIIVRDTHMFEIVVPVNGQLVLSFHGESVSFMVCDLLKSAKEVTFDGKKVLQSPETGV